jgi:hypothetical protein
LLFYVFAPARRAPAAAHELERTIERADDAQLMLARANGVERRSRPGALEQLQK